MGRRLRVGLGLVSKSGNELPRLLVGLVLCIAQLGDGVGGAG
jgi:hypothetical protein